MVSWWKRLLYSLASVLAAIIVICTFIQILEAFGGPNVHGLKGEFLATIGDFLFFGLPGWLLAVPIVLVVADTRGWRFWMYWAIGSSIGPLMIVGIALYTKLTSPAAEGFTPGSIAFLVFVTAAVSCLTTLIYLLSLRLAQQVHYQNMKRPVAPAS